MSFALGRNWWSLVIRGILGILVGIAAFARPGITLAVLVMVFGAYALINGIISIVGAVRAAEARERWGGLLLEGIFGIVAGLITFFWPHITAIALVFVIAFWAILSGIAEITTAVRLRKHISGEWLMGLAGVVSILFGVLMAAAPLIGVFVIAIWFGIFAFIWGVVLLALGLRIRHWTHHGIPGSAMPLPAH